MSDVANSETASSIDDKLQTPPSGLSKEWILKEYSDVFEGLGCMDGQYHMKVDEAVWPVVHPPRKVPVALRDRLKEELDKLVNEGIITLVTEPTKWVSSLFKVNKPEKLRICIDRQDLNKALLRAHYPLPTIEEVETRLSKVRCFLFWMPKSVLAGTTGQRVILSHNLQYTFWPLSLAAPAIWCEDST